MYNIDRLIDCASIFKKAPEVGDFPEAMRELSDVLRMVDRKLDYIGNFIPAEIKDEWDRMAAAGELSAFDLASHVANFGAYAAGVASAASDDQCPYELWRKGQIAAWQRGRADALARAQTEGATA